MVAAGVDVDKVNLDVSVSEGPVVHVAHPARVRAFTRAGGYEAKTDPRDAQVLSRYEQVFPDAQIPQSELEPLWEGLQDLLSRRRQFVA